VTRPPLRSRAALGALLVCAVTMPLLSGCTLSNRVFHRGGSTAACHERPFAGNASSRPGLKIPEGLSAPDTRNAVKVPALSMADQRPKSEPCLALPPNFFDKPLQPATGKPVAPAPAAVSAPAALPPSTPPREPAPAPAPAPSAPAPTAPTAAPPAVEAPGEPMPPG
jgi:hypothetical protein